MQGSSASTTGPEPHDLPLFPFSGILIASQSRFSPDAQLPGAPSCSCHSQLHTHPIVLVLIAVVPSCTNLRRRPKHDLVRSSTFSFCHDACSALKHWRKARHLHLRPKTTRQEDRHPGLYCTHDL